MSAPDRLTVLRTRGPLATKRVTRPDGQWHVEPYGNARHFAVRQIEVSDLPSLARALEELQHDPHSFVIRGEPLPGTNLARCRRLLYEDVDEQTGEVAEPTFGPASRPWIALDFDGLPTPIWKPGVTAAPIDPVRDWAIVTAAAAGTLPAEFHGASCWWQMTSSAGIKPGIKLRQWYWLDRLVNDAEATRWLAGAPVDRALFNPVQAHYVAAPIFDPPELDPAPLFNPPELDMDDPASLFDSVPRRGARRSGINWRHSNVVAVPELREQAPPPAPEIRAPSAPPGDIFTGWRATRYAESVLRSVASAREGERHGTLVRAARKLYSLADVGHLNEGEVTRALDAAGAAALNERERQERCIARGGLSDNARALAWARASARLAPSLPEGF